MSWIRTVQIENLRGPLGIRKLDRVPNSWIREVAKRLDQQIDESILRGFGHIKRMGKDIIAKGGLIQRMTT